MEDMGKKKEIIIECPHCKGTVVIEQLNCKIFRHGTFKKDGKQMNPHETKEKCDKFVKDELIHGCGKPFKVISKENEYISVECDYI